MGSRSVSLWGWRCLVYRATSYCRGRGGGILTLFLVATACGHNPPSFEQLEHEEYVGMRDTIVRLAERCVLAPLDFEHRRYCDALAALDSQITFSTLLRSREVWASQALAELALRAKLPADERTAGELVPHLRRVVMADIDACNPPPLAELALLLQYRAQPALWRGDLMARLSAWVTGDWERASAAALAFEFLGDAEAESALIEALTQQNSWSVARQAARALGRLPTVGTRARAQLADVAKHHWSADVRDAASEALGLAEDSRGYRDIEARLAEWHPRCQPLTHLAEEIDPEARFPYSGHSRKGTCAQLEAAGQNSIWRVRWRGTLVELAPTDNAEKRRQIGAGRCATFRERCEPHSDVRVDRLDFDGWKGTIAPRGRFILDEQSRALHRNLYETTGGRCQRKFELPGDPLRWRLVGDSLIIVTTGGALAMTVDGAVEPVECL